MYSIRSICGTSSSTDPTERSAIPPPPPTAEAEADGSEDVDAAVERVPPQPSVVSSNGFDEDGKGGKLGQTLIEKDGRSREEEEEGGGGGGGGGGESDFTLMPTSAEKNRGGRIKRPPTATDDGTLLFLLFSVLHICLRSSQGPLVELGYFYNI